MKYLFHNTISICNYTHVKIKNIYILFTISRQSWLRVNLFQLFYRERKILITRHELLL